MHSRIFLIAGSHLVPVIKLYVSILLCISRSSWVICYLANVPWKKEEDRIDSVAVYLQDGCTCVHSLTQDVCECEHE